MITRTHVTLTPPEAEHVNEALSLKSNPFPADTLGKIPGAKRLRDGGYALVCEENQASWLRCLLGYD